MSEIKYVWKSIRVPETDYDGCYNCIHTHDSEDVCRVRGCVHAIGQIKDFYKRAADTHDNARETHSCVNERTETHDKRTETHSCDLISQQDVIDELNDEVPCTSISQAHENDWIPVSEKLPEETGEYLTTTMYGEVHCDYWQSCNFNRTEMVIAWMPLPEAYKAGEMNDANSY